MRIERITPELVDLAPRVLEPGRLYISHKYRAAVHLCCCGCGEKVVTPLSPAEWRVQVTGDRVTVHPSIGNWSMPCQSHYVIRDSSVIWAPRMSKGQIRAVFERDQRDLKRLHQAAPTNTDRKQTDAETAKATSSPSASGSWFDRVKDFWRRLIG